MSREAHNIPARSRTFDFWRQLIQLDRNEIAPSIALRNAVGITLPLVVALVTGTSDYGADLIRQQLWLSAQCGLWVLAFLLHWMQPLQVLVSSASY